MPGTEFNAFNYHTWGPAVKQSITDKARALQNLENPDLAGIASGVEAGNSILGVTPGVPVSGWALETASHGGLAAVVGQSQAALNNLSGNVAALFNPVGPLFGPLGAITAWIDATSFPLGYLEVGKFSGGNFISLLLAATGLPQAGYQLGDAWSDAGVGARHKTQYELTRLINAPLFLFGYNGDETEDLLPNLLDLRFVDPALQHNGESDVDFLNRLNPSGLWQAHLDGTPFAGKRVTTSYGAQYVYYYAPAGVSPYALKRLWDYTPSSGPPVRNAIEDLMTLLTLVPISW